MCTVCTRGVRTKWRTENRLSDKLPLAMALHFRKYRYSNIDKGVKGRQQLTNNYQHQQEIRTTSLFVYNNNNFNTDRLSTFMSAVGNICLREYSRTYRHFSHADILSGSLFSVRHFVPWHYVRDAFSTAKLSRATSK